MGQISGEEHLALFWCTCSSLSKYFFATASSSTYKLTVSLDTIFAILPSLPYRVHSQDVFIFQNICALRVPPSHWLGELLHLPNVTSPLMTYTGSQLAIFVCTVFGRCGGEKSVKYLQKSSLVSSARLTLRGIAQEMCLSAL